MRTITFLCLSTLLVGCLGSKNKKSAAINLNGSWQPVKEELAGAPLPAAMMEKQKLVIKDSTYIFGAESVDKGTLKYGKGKMDIWGKDGVNAGKHFTAIYKYKDGELTICYNLAGDSYPNEYKSVDHPLFFLAVFKKDAEK